MSRRTTQKKRVRRPVVRETRSIAKDNSVIGFLSFVGVFLFLVLMGLLFFDNKQTKDPGYDENNVFVDSSKTTPLAIKDPKSTENAKKQEIAKEESEKQNQPVKENTDEKAETNNPGIENLPEVVDKKTENEKKLSPNEMYRDRYDAARRSGKVEDLLELAEWCKENDMAGRTEDIYNYVVKISPDNLAARKALGYIRTDSKWILEKNAELAGYYKHNGEWLSAKSLKAKGLYLYEGQWITFDEGKEKGLVKHNDQLVTKEELATLKEQEKQRKEDAEQNEKEKKQVTQGSPKEEKKSVDKPTILSYRHIKIFSPPKGNWSTTRSGRTSQVALQAPIVNNSNQGSGLVDTLVDEESGIVLNVQGFSPEILYTFPDGSAAQGSEIQNLMDVFRGDAFNKYDDIQFQDVKRSRYGKETITQQLGVGKLENKPYGVLLSFFRYETLTYAITVTYPMENYDKAMESKILYLFNNMKKLK